MNWIPWARNILLAHAELEGIVSDRIFSSGTLSTGTPTTPFLMLRQGPTIPRLGGATEQTELTVYGHDRSGTYTRVKDALSAVREALSAFQEHPGGGSHPYLRVVWQGRSGELADDALETLMMNDSYLLLEARR